MSGSKKEDTAENRREVGAYLDPVRQVVQPVAVGLFAGVMDYGRLPFPLRLLMKAMKAPQGDFRDWEAIRAWAGQGLLHDPLFAPKAWQRFGE